MKYEIKYNDKHIALGKLASINYLTSTNYEKPPITSHVYYDDATQRSGNGTWNFTYDEPVSFPYLTFKFDGYMPTVSDIFIMKNTTELARFRSHSTSSLYWGFAKSPNGFTNYQIITAGNGSATVDRVEYHRTGVSASVWHTVKFVIDRNENTGWLYLDDTNYGKFTCKVDWAEANGIKLLRETNNSSFKNVKVTGYSTLEQAIEG